FTNTAGSATTNAATLTVNARPVTITPNSGQGKTYGTTDPTLTYTSSESLLSGNSFSGALSRAAGENVGNYVIGLGDLSAGSNYALSLSATPVTFAVTAKQLTGSFTAFSKVYDGTDGATIDTRSLSGVVGNDDVSLSGGTATFFDASAGTGKTVTGT